MDRLSTSNGSLLTSKANSGVRARGLSWIVIALIGLALPFTVRGKSSYSFGLPECTYAECYTGHMNIVVPLPYDIAQTAHEPVLHELNDLGKLPDLISARSDVYSSVMGTNRELARLACALKRHSYADGNEKKAKFALSKEVNSVCEQLKYTAANVSWLYNLYSSIQPAYHEYNLTIANALKVTQLDDRKLFMVSAQPLFHKWIGFDYKKMYWDPWKQKERQMKETQLSIVALEKEIERVKMIVQIIHEVGLNFEDLTITLVGKLTEITQHDGSLLRRYYALSKKGLERFIGGNFGGDSQWENSLKDRYWQHVARYVIQDKGNLTDSQFDTQ